MKERSPLLQRSIFALLSAEIISSLGAQMTFLALPWFVLTTTGSTTRMGIVLAAELLPIALLGIPSGAVVTRLGAVQTMLVCDLARIPLMVSIPLLYEAGLLLSHCCSCSSSCSDASSRRTSPPSGSCCRSSSARTRRRSTQANAVVEAGSRLTILLGPLAGRGADRLDRRDNVLYVDAATYAVSFSSCSFFVPRRPPLPATADGSGLLAGLRFVLARPAAATDARDGRLPAHVRAGDLHRRCPSSRTTTSARAHARPVSCSPPSEQDRSSAASPRSHSPEPCRRSAWRRPASSGSRAPLLLLGLDLPPSG